MKPLYTAWRLALVVGFFCVVFIPSTALAASVNEIYTEIHDNNSKQISVPKTTMLKASTMSEELNSKQDVQDKDIWSSILNVFAGIAVFTTGIVAGTVFAYANSVMPGLRNSDDRTFVLSIRHLTSSVANPAFLIMSNGALIAQIGFLAVAVSLQQFDKIILGSIALIFYVATLLITFLGNLPLNKAIISAELPKSESKWHELRVRFESRWTSLNHMRTLSCILSVSVLIVAVLIN